MALYERVGAQFMAFGPWFYHLPRADGPTIAATFIMIASGLQWLEWLANVGGMLLGVFSQLSLARSVWLIICHHGFYQNITVSWASAWQLVAFSSTLPQGSLAAMGIVSRPRVWLAG